MQVSFIIPLFNCLALTRAMVASLQATLPRNLSHEIILVDDGSTDGTREWLATLQAPFRVILNERNLGYAKGNNRGAAIAGGDFLFFLNNDLVLLPKWFEPMIDLLERRADAGLIGNVQLNAATRAIDHSGIRFNHKGKPEHITSLPCWIRPAGIRVIAAVTGACFATRRVRWLELAGFDEEFMNGGEDIDLCLRTLERGWRNYVVTRSRVLHHISQSPGRKLRDERNTRLLVNRWQHVILPRMLHACSRACLLASWTEPRNYVNEKLVRLALRHLCGLSQRAPKPIVAAGQASMKLEEARWANMIDGAPMAPEREMAWAFFPAVIPPYTIL
jgi:O-antigen biosynthesis protein